MPGDDVAIVLDYRSDPSDPRVVASDFWTQPEQCAWRIVGPTLCAFAGALGLLAERRSQGFPLGRLVARSCERGRTVGSFVVMAVIAVREILGWTFRPSGGHRSCRGGRWCCERWGRA
jgi:hypothetical protein